MSRERVRVDGKSSPEVTVHLDGLYDTPEVTDEAMADWLLKRKPLQDDPLRARASWWVVFGWAAAATAFLCWVMW